VTRKPQAFLVGGGRKERERIEMCSARRYSYIFFDEEKNIVFVQAKRAIFARQIFVARKDSAMVVIGRYVVKESVL